MLTGNEREDRTLARGGERNPPRTQQLRKHRFLIAVMGIALIVAALGAGLKFQQVHGAHADSITNATGAAATGAAYIQGCPQITLNVYPEDTIAAGQSGPYIIDAEANGWHGGWDLTGTVAINYQTFDIAIGSPTVDLTAGGVYDITFKGSAVPSDPTITVDLNCDNLSAFNTVTASTRAPVSLGN